MPRLRRSASQRPRVRLLSTPGTTYPDHEGTSVSSTICGVKFSDQTAALLDHAAHQPGWRAEAQHRRNASKPTGVVLYSPDKTISPIAVYEEKARFNPAHYDNVRRMLYRAGLPPLPGDEARAQTTDPADTTEDTAPMPKTAANPFVSPAANEQVITVNGLRQLVERGSKGDVADALTGVVEGMFLSAGAHDDTAALASILVYSLKLWDDERTKDPARSDEVDQAMALAAEAEARANRLEKAVEKADEKTAQAIADLRSWKDRAEAAEASAAAAEAAMAPLRAFLAGGKS